MPFEKYFLTLFHRDIRRKGRNKIHALKCRQKNRDEVKYLEVIFFKSDLI